MPNSAAFTEDGMAVAAARLKGTGTEPKQLGWGTGTTPADPGDSGLETPSAEARTAGTSSIQTVNVTNDCYQVVGDIVSLSAQAITELGLFDDPTAGALFAHFVFDALNLQISDSVEFTVQVVAGAAA
ncbi:MAG TPA: hypothetical protein VNI57_01465 [Candidatus Saccharimonadales bacterium]|nr:hypothetical protein [Candidatus Saccharimonadales bacterium]